MHSTGVIRTEPIWIIWIRPAVASQITRSERARSRRLGPRRVVVKIEDLPVERVGCRRRSEFGIDVGHGYRFKFRTGENYLRRVRKHDAYALGIKKEKQLVFLYWPTQGTRPLVCVIEGTRISLRIVKPVVGIQHASVPVVLCIPVKTIAAGFCQVVDASSCRAAELAGIPTADDGRFLNLVLTQHHPRDAAVVGIRDRKSTRLNSSHRCISYAVFCLK